MDRYRVNLTAAEVGRIKLTGKQRAAIKFLATEPGQLPSGGRTPEPVVELIGIGLVGEGVKFVGLEGESKSEFYLTPSGEVWWKANGKEAD